MDFVLIRLEWVPSKLVIVVMISQMFVIVLLELIGLLDAMLFLLICLLDAMLFLFQSMLLFFQMVFFYLKSILLLFVRVDFGIVVNSELWINIVMALDLMTTA